MKTKLKKEQPVIAYGKSNNKLMVLKEKQKQQIVEERGRPQFQSHSLIKYRWNEEEAGTL